MKKTSLMPQPLRRKAIEYAKAKTGLERPHRSQLAYIESFEECFQIMLDLNMIKEEFTNGEETKED